MTFEQFQATGKDCADIGAVTGDDWLQGAVGRVYLDTLYIEQWTDARAGSPPPNGPTWLLTLGNTQPEGELADMEKRLYDWAQSEGYFEVAA